MQPIKRSVSLIRHLSRPYWQTYNLIVSVEVQIC